MGLAAYSKEMRIAALDQAGPGTMCQRRGCAGRGKTAIGPRTARKGVPMCCWEGGTAFVSSVGVRRGEGHGK